MKDNCTTFLPSTRAPYRIIRDETPQIGSFRFAGRLEKRFLSSDSKNPRNKRGEGGTFCACMHAAKRRSRTIISIFTNLALANPLRGPVQFFSLWKLEPVKNLNFPLLWTFL